MIELYAIKSNLCNEYLDDFKGGVPNEWFFFSNRSKDDGTIALDGGYYEIDPEGAGPITWEGKVVGYVKTLNFYQGSSPNGTETEWMVEEFRVNPEFVPINNDRSTREKVVQFTRIYTVFQCICFRKYTLVRLMML